MKKIQLIELLRMFRSTAVLFISIAVVTALGVVAFCGISFTSSGVTQMGERYYNNANFYDIKIISAYGFDTDDLAAISRTDGVSDVCSEYLTHKLISVGNKNIVAEFFTQSDTINLPDLKEGRLPETENDVHNRASAC